MAGSVDKNLLRVLRASAVNRTKKEDRGARVPPRSALSIVNAKLDSRPVRIGLGAVGRIVADELALGPLVGVADGGLGLFPAEAGLEPGAFPAAAELGLDVVELVPRVAGP